MSKNSGLNYPGIYTITRIASGSVYVGQAINIRVRWQHHNRDLRKNRHRNFVLQTAWNEHGHGAFVFAVVRDLRDVPLDRLAAALNAAEIEVLASFHRSYNLMEAGYSGTTASAATREILSRAQTANWATPGRREKQVAAIKALYADPVWKAARDAAVKEGKNSTKTKSDVSVQMKALWQTPEHQATQSAKRVANWEDPAYRAQQSASRAATWADPAVRKRRTDGIKAAHARRRAKEQAWSKDLTEKTD